VDTHTHTRIHTTRTRPSDAVLSALLTSAAIFNRRYNDYLTTTCNCDNNNYHDYIFY